MLLIFFSGTLKALELENQVLKLRNAQLELAGNTETLKGWYDNLTLKFLFECIDSIALLMKSELVLNLSLHFLFVVGSSN
jgi:hypothetical protein